jgi:hypothetical protein
VDSGLEFTTELGGAVDGLATRLGLAHTGAH